MIPVCAKKLTDTLIKHSAIDVELDQREVYIYGLECLLNTGLTVILLTIWGIVTNSLLETLFWIVCFIKFRNYTGGFHAPTQLTCVLSSILLGCSNYFVIELIEPSSALFLIIYLFCAITCLLFAPVETTKKPLTHKLRVHYKLISLSILGVCFLINPFLPIKIGTSISYAFVCTAFLVLIPKTVQKKGP